MSVENPYQAPVAQNETATPAPTYKQLHTVELNKLYHRSRNIGAIAALCTIGVIVMGFVASMPLIEPNEFQDSESQAVIAILGSIGLFQLIAAIGLFKRTSWGKILGFVVCAIMLVNIPIGTLIGIVGIIALSQGGDLFGANRITHKELKAEFILRKQQKKEAKRAAKLAKKAA